MQALSLSPLEMDLLKSKCNLLQWKYKPYPYLANVALAMPKSYDAKDFGIKAIL